ncbi:hypothetical protein MMC08_008224 [Hypocenomyce scalaris]|nr:hypothetical protein [Hypocenomyce scalaris]
MAAQTPINRRTSQPPSSLTGSCGCGTFTWSSTALPSSVVYCHCVTCRKFSGAAFLPFGDFGLDAISWRTDGVTSPMPHRDLIKTLSFDDTAQRGSCKTCGTPLFMKYRCQPETIAICMGTMDVESVRGRIVNPSAHIFTSQKLPWYDVENDGLAKYERHRPGFQEDLDRWLSTREASPRSDWSVETEETLG